MQRGRRGSADATGWARPASLAEACDLLTRTPRPVLVAGATDLYGSEAARRRVRRADPVDLSGLADELGRLEVATNRCRLGALTSWHDLVHTALPPALRGLQQAGASIGAPPLRRRATVGGNLCTASPAADGVPALIALGAQVELVSTSGIRRLPVEELARGPHRTSVRPDEILRAVEAPLEGTSCFAKLQLRRGAGIAVVNAAAYVVTGPDGAATVARVCVGAASPRPVRLPRLEARLRDVPVADWGRLVVDAEDVRPLQPIDDVRATGGYRVHGALVLLRRMLAELARQVGPLAVEVTA